MTVDAVRIRNVEWPMKVTATRPGSTRAGGGLWGAIGARDGHGVCRRVRIHVITSRSGRALSCGLKNRSPSQ
jgi:hypothetical protein